MREWRPTARQELFLRDPSFEVLFGGAAGGGKSEAGLIGALRNIHLPGYRALLLRRTYPELVRSLIERSQDYYRGAGGRYIASKKEWRWSSGAVIEFGHLERDVDVHNYQSAEYQYVYFDELTTFSEYQYRYLISRIRSARGIPGRLRAGTNPPADERGAWVLKRFAPWLYKPGRFEDEYDGPYLKPAQPGLFAAIDGVDTLVPTDSMFECSSCGAIYKCTEHVPIVDKDCHHPSALSRVFIPSLLSDNPHLAQDGEYAKNLQALDPVTYAQLAHGDWFSRPAPGLYFKRESFQISDTPPLNPELVSVCRYWDRAATAALGQGEYAGPDYTCGVLMARDRQGRLWVLDVQRFREEPPEVEQRIVETTKHDVARFKSLYTAVLEQDPGQAGKVEMHHWARILAEYAIDFVRPTGDKIARAKPWSSQVRLHMVLLARGVWNEAYVREHTRFPSQMKDDQVDASSGACWYSTAAFVAAKRPEPGDRATQRIFRRGSTGGY